MGPGGGRYDGIGVGKLALSLTMIEKGTKRIGFGQSLEATNHRMFASTIVLFVAFDILFSRSQKIDR